MCKSKKDSKGQKTIQSSTTPVPGYKMEKYQNNNKHHKQEPGGQPFPSDNSKAAMSRRESMKRSRKILFVSLWLISISALSVFTLDYQNRTYHYSIYL